MKKILTNSIILLFAVYPWVADASAGSSQRKEKPFIALITNQELYESCKEAVDLYNKRDRRYILTPCMSQIHGMNGTLYGLAGRKLISSDFVTGECSFYPEKEWAPFLSDFDYVVGKKSPIQGAMIIVSYTHRT
jgi:hypothetical protein